MFPWPAEGQPLRLNCLMVEIERFKQVTKRRSIEGNVGVTPCRYRVREVVPATEGNGTDVPVPLDEFVDGDMVRISVGDMATLRELRDHKQRDACAIAEEIERLNVTG